MKFTKRKYLQAHILGYIPTRKRLSLLITSLCIISNIIHNFHSLIIILNENKEIKIISALKTNCFNKTPNPDLSPLFYKADANFVYVKQSRRARFQRRHEYSGEWVEWCGFFLRASFQNSRTIMIFNVAATGIWSASK